MDACMPVSVIALQRKRMESFEGLSRWQLPDHHDGHGVACSRSFRRILVNIEVCATSERSSEQPTGLLAVAFQRFGLSFQEMLSTLIHHDRIKATIYVQRYG